MITDSHNRVHNYLRISITDNCNLRCFYCMPEEDYAFTPPNGLMKAHEIEKLAGIFVQQGVTKIRITGGEPLIRKDAADIILRLSKMPVHLTLTTNGARIHEFTDVLQTAGINDINVSLDTLSPEKFQLITRRNQFQQVYENIQLLLSRHFHVKVNMVVMKGLNDDELENFVEWTRDVPVHIRFIEFMPFAGNRWTSNKVFSMQEMLQQIKGRYEVIRLKDEKNATAKSYKAKDHLGTFAVISTMSENFCGTCNRIRLTADGKMKNCLFAEKETDLLTALRNGEEIETLIHQNIRTKAKELGGQFTSDFLKVHAKDIHNRSMITIGG